MRNIPCRKCHGNGQQKGINKKIDQVAAALIVIDDLLAFILFYC